MLIDISPPLTASTAVWPGDTPLSRTVQLQLANGESVDLSTLTTTVHIGAHADAPCHYAHSAPSIDQVGLEAYVGPCQVIDCQAAAKRPSRLVLPEDLGQVWDNKVPRVLFRTAPGADPNIFPADFVAIAPKTMDFLGSMGCLLVGIDTPSIDPFASKDLAAHQRLFANKMRNLEGLDLTDAEPGFYELIALPLKLVGFDASPVRAVLRK